MSKGEGTPEARLLALFRRLNAADQVALLRFAEFLAAEAGEPEPVPTSGTREPEAQRDIPRPKDESVIQALRRLTETYPMLDRRELLGPTSELMTQHMLQGRDAEEVIEELEKLYRERYEDYRRQWSGGAS